MNQVPQHPGNTQGLGSPTAAQQPQVATNPYVHPNVALMASTANVGLGGNTVPGQFAQPTQTMRDAVMAPQPPEDPMVTHTKQLAGAMLTEGVPPEVIYTDLLKQGATENEASQMVGRAVQMRDEAKARREADIAARNTADQNGLGPVPILR